MGFVNPTPIQQAAIPPLLEGRDVLGQAQTGTGKTAAFGLPALARLDVESKATQVLVLAPTRELALQVAEAFTDFAGERSAVSIVAIFGGAPYGPQLQALRRGAQVVVGTPGRVIDHLERGTLRLEDIRFVILDEADEMLRMGFYEDVVAILERAPEVRQSALFSATMPPDIRSLTHRFLRDPVHVSFAPGADHRPNIRQAVCYVHEEDSAEAVARFLEATPTLATLVFVRTKQATLDIATLLQDRGLRATALNGDLPQPERLRAVERLRDGLLDVVVATDVAARGLDVERIARVVNLDLPRDPASYVHRIGRTGRAGREGEALLLVPPRAEPIVRRYERSLGVTMERVTLPTAEALNTARRARVVAELAEKVAQAPSEEHRALVEAFCTETGADAVGLAAALVAERWPSLRRDLRPISAPPLPSERASRRREATRPGPPASGRSSTGPAADAGRGRAAAPRRGEGDGLVRYRVDVGKVHGLHAKVLVDAIVRATGLDQRRVGDIRIEADHAFVDLPAGMPGWASERLATLKVLRRPLRLRRA